MFLHDDKGPMTVIIINISLKGISPSLVTTEVKIRLNYTQYGIR